MFFEIKTNIFRVVVCGLYLLGPLFHKIDLELHGRLGPSLAQDANVHEGHYWGSYILLLAPLT